MGGGMGGASENALLPAQAPVRRPCKDRSDGLRPIRRRRFRPGLLAGIGSPVCGSAGNAGPGGADAPGDHERHPPGLTRRRGHSAIQALPARRPDFTAGCALTGDPHPLGSSKSIRHAQKAARLPWAGCRMPRAIRHAWNGDFPGFKVDLPSLPPGSNSWPRPALPQPVWSPVRTSGPGAGAGGGSGGPAGQRADGRRRAAGR